jgi:thiol-disulfide isomerase/thioredoxin
MKPILIALVTSLLMAAATVNAETSAATPNAPAATDAPKWTLKDLDGKPVSSETFKGKVIVLDFWATWCGPCRMEIPGYVALQKKYGKEGVVMIGVSLDEKGPAVVKPFIAKYGVDYQIVMGDEAFANLFGGIEAIPTTFIIDRSGKIRDKKVGAEPTEDFEKRLLAVLKK